MASLCPGHRGVAPAPGRPAVTTPVERPASKFYGHSSFSWDPHTPSPGPEPQPCRRDHPFWPGPLHRPPTWLSFQASFFSFCQGEPSRVQSRSLCPNQSASVQTPAPPRPALMLGSKTVTSVSGPPDWPTSFSACHTLWFIPLLGPSIFLTELSPKHALHAPFWGPSAESLASPSPHQLLPPF